MVPIIEVQRRYRKNTLILETDFYTEDGIVRLVDFMPPAAWARTLSGVPICPLY